MLVETAARVGLAGLVFESQRWTLPVSYRQGKGGHVGVRDDPLESEAAGTGAGPW